MQLRLLIPHCFLISISLEHIFSQIRCQNGSGNLKPISFLYWFLFGVAYGIWGCRHDGIHCWYAFWWLRFRGDERTTACHSKFLLDIYILKTYTIMLLCNLAPCLVYSCGVFDALWIFTNFKDLFFKNLVY